MSRGCVIGILGPTGAGKTAVAVELAGLLGTKIISCDSMQVYAGFPVLTNQPWSAADHPDLHELVGFMDPCDTVSAGEYAELAGSLIERELKEHGWALVVGGSGLYMRAALAPLASAGPADMELRDRLEQVAHSLGAEELHAQLESLDHEAAAAIDHRNVRRVIRALEGALGGVRWSGRADLWEPRYYHPTLIVGLSMDRSLLGERIRARAEKMLKGGAVDEVCGFCLERGEERARPGRPGISSAIGYAEIWRYLAGGQALGETIDQTAAATRRYARRQMTWLRKVGDAVMIEAQSREPGDMARQIASLAEGVIHGKEPD